MSRPRPVLTSAGIAGLITSVAGVLAFLGYNDASTKLSGSATTLTAVALGVVILGSHLLAGLHGQGKVTPKASPQTDAGIPLVPAFADPVAAAPADPAPDVTAALAAADAIYPAAPAAV